VTFKATETFWRKFYALSPAQKQLVREKWKLFKLDPFDPRLGTHKIHLLSARKKKPSFDLFVRESAAL
jgi:hypothetical protein